MLEDNYSSESFDALSDIQKWKAYYRLRTHAESIQKKLNTKTGVIFQKREKVNYLRTAREEIMRQVAIRNQSGSNARRAAYQDRKERLIAIFVELEADSVRRIAEALAGNYLEPDSTRITAKHVLAVFEQRHPEQSIELSTVRSYLRDFKNWRDRSPNVALTIVD